MPRTDLRQQAIRRTPTELLKHLKSFELAPKFSAGIWCFSPPHSRFHEKYKPDLPIEGRLEIAGRLAENGLSALEAHYPNEINENNLQLWKSFSRSSGIRLLTVIPLLFMERQFEWGSLSNPDSEVRKTATERLIAALRMNRELDTDFAIVWAGIDGYENAFGIDFLSMRDRFAEGMAEALDSVPGVRIAFEPKPYEPRGRILFGTTAEGILLGREVEALLKSPDNRKALNEGHTLCCLNPEIGHVLMGYEDLPYAYSLALGEGRLAHMHINSQPLGNYDQDLNAGAVSPEQLEALLYVLKMHGYAGYFGIDINPERMPIDAAIRINIDAVRSACDRINSLDHESILAAAADPDHARGWIESYLIRSRAPGVSRLTPLPPFKSNG